MIYSSSDLLLCLLAVSCFGMTWASPEQDPDLGSSTTLTNSDSDTETNSNSNSTPYPLSNLIEWDIGGHLYKTSRETIMSHPESELARIVFTQESKHPKDRDYFLDRDSEAFRYVLSYLRYGRLHWESGSPVTLSLIIQEATYFMLPDLVKQAEAKIEKHDPNKIKWIIGERSYVNQANALIKTPDPDQIEWTIGGRSYVTTRDEILSHPNSMLAAKIRFEDNPEERHYVLNGNPDVFFYIYNYLRTGKLHWGPHGPVTLSLIIHDADYYGLPDLKYQAQAMIDSSIEETPAVPSALLELYIPTHWSSTLKDYAVVARGNSVNETRMNERHAHFPDVRKDWRSLGDPFNDENWPEAKKAFLMTTIASMNEKIESRGEAWRIHLICDMPSYNLDSYVYLEKVKISRRWN